MHKNNFFIFVSVFILLVILFLIYLSINLYYTWRDFFGTIIGSLFGLEGTLLVVQYSKSNTENQIQADRIIHNSDLQANQMKAYKQSLSKYDDRLDNLAKSISNLKNVINFYLNKNINLTELSSVCNGWLEKLRGINSNRKIMSDELGSVITHLYDLMIFSHISVMPRKKISKALDEFDFYDELLNTVMNQTQADMYYFIERENKSTDNINEQVSSHQRISSFINEFDFMQRSIKNISDSIVKLQ